MTLLVFTLLRPEYVQRIERNGPPEIAILTDASDSMKTRDLIVSNAVVSRAQWLDKQKHRQFWRPLEKKAKVSVEDFATPSSNAPVSGTDLSGPLEAALSRTKISRPSCF